MHTFCTPFPRWMGLVLLLLLLQSVPRPTTAQAIVPEEAHQRGNDGGHARAGLLDPRRLVGTGYDWSDGY